MPLTVMSSEWSIYMSLGRCSSLFVQSGFHFFLSQNARQEFSPFPSIIPSPEMTNPWTCDALMSAEKYVHVSPSIRVFTSG